MGKQKREFLKPEGQAVLVCYIVIACLFAGGMWFGWMMRGIYVEDKVVLCKAYEKFNKAKI